MQAIVDAMSKAGEETRSGYHLTLGALIAKLRQAAPEAFVQFEDGKFPCEPHSYRGYYSDLAFSSSDEPVTAGELLVVAKECLGKVFTGYKGGDFRMHEKTPLWYANYGDCGPAIVSTLTAPNALILVTKEID